MKKILLLGIACLTSISVMAEDCKYAREQEIVRSAENYKEMKELGEDFDANKIYPCGGTLSQLAVLRGNLSMLNYLYMHGADFNTTVSLKGYEIPGAPETIPFPLFVARYAPNSQIMDVMINSGVNFKVKDSKGHDVFWYLERNPVLRRTYLTKMGWDAFKTFSERLKEEKERKD